MKWVLKRENEQSDAIFIAAWKGEEMEYYALGDRPLYATFSDSVLPLYDDADVVEVSDDDDSEIKPGEN